MCMELRQKKIENENEIRRKKQQPKTKHRRHFGYTQNSQGTQEK